MRTLYVDRVCLFSFLRLMLARNLPNTVWYFEPPSRFARLITLIFKLVYLGKVELRHTQIHVTSGDLIGFQKDVRRLCSEIRKTHLLKSPLVECMRGNWNPAKVSYYLDQIVETTIRPQCWQIAIVKHEPEDLLHRPSIQHAKLGLIVAHSRWKDYVRKYAGSKNVVLLSYPNVAPIGEEIRRILRILRFSVLVSPHAMRLITKRIFSGRPRKKSDNLTASHSVIGIQYYFRKLGFDPSERSEFFWFDGADLSDKNFLLYQYNSNKPLDSSTKEDLDRHGVRLMGMAPGISSWVPTFGMWWVLCQSLTKMTFGVLKLALRGQWFSLYYFWHGIHLVASHAYWHDFFSVNKIGINVVPLNNNVAQNLALDSCGGVGVGFQYSLSVFVATTMTAGTSDVQFVFSPQYEQANRGVTPPTDVYLLSGYIYDGSFEPLRNAERTKRLRDQIRSRGADFIICFFDEGPVDRWDSTYWAKHLRDEYAYLLDWVLEDPSLAVIFKPKRSLGLREILAPISEKIDRAVQTGRCAFLTGESMVSTIFPAEAAMASDLCIGKITGATASLEAQLAGVRSVLLDNDNFGNHPLRDWDSSNFIFDDWQSLHEAISLYRNEPASNAEFGDWSIGIDDIDPFRDGLGGARIGRYVGLICEGLRDGLSKVDAMERAKADYDECWPINASASLTGMKDKS